MWATHKTSILLGVSFIVLLGSFWLLPQLAFVVFIALLPQSIDDRPIRMISVMLGSMAVYLCLSRFLKSPAAFRLDMLNGAAFLVTGIVFYFIICSRNVRDTYQSPESEVRSTLMSAAVNQMQSEQRVRSGSKIYTSVAPFVYQAETIASKKRSRMLSAMVIWSE